VKIATTDNEIEDAVGLQGSCAADENSLGGDRALRCLIVNSKIPTIVPYQLASFSF
jgi:hypothetical protein